MKTIICGPRDFFDYEEVLKAIEYSGFNITEVVSGGATGVDNIGEKYAAEKGIPVRTFKPDWDDIECENVKVKTNKFGKQYNALAGFNRNGKMVDYADACIAVDVGSPGTSDTISKSKKGDINLYVYIPYISDQIESIENVEF